MFGITNAEFRYNGRQRNLLLLDRIYINQKLLKNDNVLKYGRAKDISALNEMSLILANYYTLFILEYAVC
jgi:hypothetical protein